MKDLMVMCGISGSGKSTWAESHFSVATTRIVSTDAIRKEIWGDENNQQQSNKIFEVAFCRISFYLQQGFNVIFDATNLSSRDRREIVKKYRGITKQLICVDFGNDVQQALKNQESRVRKVPTEIIERQAKKYRKPTSDEGWDVILEAHME